MFLKNYQVEEKDFELLFSKFRRIEYAKGEIIIGADRLSDEIFLVESGLTRGYFWDTKGNEVTECFGGERRPVCLDVLLLQGRAGFSAIRGGDPNGALFYP